MPIDPLDHGGLVGLASRRYARSAVDHEDLNQAGFLGILNAVRTFNPALGFSFASYALPAIRHNLAAEVHRQMPAAPVSLDAPVADGEGRTPLVDLLPAKEPALGPDVRLDIEALLGILAPRTKEMVMLRYGLGGDPELPLAEVGRRFGVSGSRAQQIITVALEKMRASAGA